VFKAPTATQRESVGQETPDNDGPQEAEPGVGGSCRSVQLEAAAKPALAARVAISAIAQQEMRSVRFTGRVVLSGPLARGADDP
jgi:hypothetical protein